MLLVFAVVLGATFWGYAMGHVAGWYDARMEMYDVLGQTSPKVETHTTEHLANQMAVLDNRLAIIAGLGNHKYSLFRRTRVTK